ncbi:hypothetical protein JCGZ_12366 [Jatropha curcas]|uniref:Uncharacterized protein n=1 Tax=Jatropha curcas TaxID=180498 RepID=A0A067KI08_JATCU|nr:hypothetical protein JCGZ_12366 [Jatropha curcas]
MLFQELVCVEGRHLKTKLCKKGSSGNNHSKSTLNFSKDGYKSNSHQVLIGNQEKTSKMDYVDEFRPTTPGHSPGVGHSINN